MYREIDKQGFNWRIWAVAGFGFFVDSYILSSTKVILPMLAFVYWHKDDTSSHELKATVVILTGSIAGQLLFGYLADRHGRLKVYRFDLILVVCVTLFLAQSSAGVYNSLSLMGWTMFWCFCAGVGIGAGSPLSATITAEFVIDLSPCLFNCAYR